MNHPVICAEIDLGAIAHNIQALRAITNPAAILMAVVKADGYGHGAVEVARAALQHGASRLAVARLDEAVALRRAGIGDPILVFGFTPPESANMLVDHNLTQTVYDLDVARHLAGQARRRQTAIKVHIKVDTGMGRLGLLPDWRHSSASPQAYAAGPALQQALAMARLPGLEIEGLFTHFAAADSHDKRLTLDQLKRFLSFDDQLRRQGLVIPIKHAANSAALIDLPETHLDLVRPGIAVYGLYPSAETSRTPVTLHPAMTLKTHVIHVKKVPAGFGVSYGHTYTTPVPATIATVAAGYADGFNRRLSSRGMMLVHGRKAPIVGRVCMDMTMLDVSHIPDIRTGDEVVIWGRQQNAEIHVDDVATLLDTINYEVISTLGQRVLRVYTPFGT